MTTFQPIFDREDILTLKKYQDYFRRLDYDKLGTLNEAGLVYINDEFFDAVDALCAATVLQIQQLSTQEVLKVNLEDYDNRLAQFLNFMQGNFEANLVQVANNRDHLMHFRLLQDVFEPNRYSAGIVASSNVKHFDSESRYNRRRDDYDEAKSILETMTFVSNIDDQLNEAVMRKNALQILQQYRYLDTNFTRFMHNKNAYENYLRGMLDNYSWSQAFTFKTGDDLPKTAYRVNDTESSDNRIGIDVTRNDIMNLMQNTNIGLNHDQLLFNGRKTVIMSVEEVSQDEINKAAKKMKFNGDLSTVRCYKILEGFKVKNSRMFNDYWFLRRADADRISPNLESLSGKFIVVSENHTSKFQAVTTSIGRSLSSVNRKVTTGVMDALELSF